MNSPHVSMHNTLVTEISRLCMGKKCMHSYWLQVDFNCSLVVACLCLMLNG